MLLSIMENDSTPQINLPGGPLSSWRMDDLRVNPEDNKQYGVVINNHYYPFDNGESIIHELNNQGERDRRIILKNGNKIPFESWKLLREERFKELFDKMDPIYGKLFQYALSDNPELNQIYIKTGTQEEYPKLNSTGGFFRRPTEENPVATVVIGTGSNYKYRELLRTREISAKSAAKDLGIDFSIMLNHPEILGAFIFCHELGHAHQFFNEFFVGQVTMKDAAKAAEESRESEISQLPVPRKDPTQVAEYLKQGSLKNYYEKYKEYYNKSLKVFSPEELARKHEEEYHKIPSESYADSFSAKLLKKYWDKLGFDKY